ncbi:MAG: DUF3526 domain-containing protein [Cyclobacteriaceae bacterium]
MVLQIALKEFKELIREGRFRIMSGAIAALLIVATVISYNYYQWVNAQHTAAKENARNVWVSQDNKNPHSAAHYGTYAFKPKYPMSLIDQGVDKYTGLSIYLEAHKRNEAQYMAAQDQTAAARFGDLTPDFILLYILPLFIILVGFNAFTREKESGTFRLLRSQGVSTVKLTIGKWLGVFLPVAIVTSIVALLSLLLLLGVRDFGEFHFGAFALLFIFFLIYYAVFTNLTLWISSLSKRSGVALVILLAVWMVSCLGMPKVANRLAESVHPYPTQNEFMAAIHEDERNGLDGHDPFSLEAKKLEEETLKAYGVDSVEQLPFNFDGLLMQKGEEHTAEIFFKHYEELKSINQAQTDVYRTASVLSPYLPARFLSMALCRTDYESHWHFNDAAEKYRIKMMEALNMHFAEASSYGDWKYKADKSLWKDIPDFDYEPVSYASIIQTNSSNILALLLWLLISSGLLYRGVSQIKTI